MAPRPTTQVGPQLQPKVPSQSQDPGDWQTLDPGDWETVGGQAAQLTKNAKVIADREAQEPQGFGIERFGKSLYNSTIGAVPEMLRTVGSVPLSVVPGETGKQARSTLYRNLVQPQVDQFKQGYRDTQNHDYLPAAGHALAGMLPIVGPMAGNIGEQAGSGDLAGAAGTTLGGALQYGGAKLAPKVPGAVAEVAPKVGPVLKGAAQGGMEAFSKGKSSIPAAAGAVIGGMISGPKGAEIGAGLGALPGTLEGMYKGAKHALAPKPYDPFGKFSEQPIAAKAPQAEPLDKFGRFTPPSGLLPKPIEVAPTDKFGQFTPQPLASKAQAMGKAIRDAQAPVSEAPTPIQSPPVGTESLKPGQIGVHQHAATQATADSVTNKVSNISKYARDQGITKSALDSLSQEQQKALVDAAHLEGRKLGRPVPKNGYKPDKNTGAWLSKDTFRMVRDLLDEGGQ